MKKQGRGATERHRNGKQRVNSYFQANAYCKHLLTYVNCYLKINTARFKINDEFVTFRSPADGASRVLLRQGGEDPWRCLSPDTARHILQQARSAHGAAKKTAWAMPPWTCAGHYPGKPVQLKCSVP